MLLILHYLNQEWICQMSRTSEEILKAAVFDDFIYAVKRGEEFPKGKTIRLKLPLPDDINQVTFAVEYMVREIVALIVPNENAGPLTERECEIEFAYRSNPGALVNFSTDDDELGASCSDDDAGIIHPGSQYFFILRYL